MLNSISVSAKRAAGERRQGCIFRSGNNASKGWKTPYKNNPTSEIMNHRKHSSQIFRYAVRDFEIRGRPCFYGVRSDY